MPKPGGRLLRGELPRNSRYAEEPPISMMVWSIHPSRILRDEAVEQKPRGSSALGFAQRLLGVI